MPVYAVICRLNPGCYQRRGLDGPSKAPISWLARVWTSHDSASAVSECRGFPPAVWSIYLLGGLLHRTCTRERMNLESKLRR